MWTWSNYVKSLVFKLRNTFLPSTEVGRGFRFLHFYGLYSYARKWLGYSKSIASMMASPTANQNQEFITKRLSTLKFQKLKKKESVDEEMEEVANDVNVQRVFQNMREFKDKQATEKTFKKETIRKRLENTLLNFVINLKKIKKQSRVSGPSKRK